jgi:hypothetical protein
MTDHEIIKLAERCVAGECTDCPYSNEDCPDVLERTLAIAKRLKAQLEQPVTAGEERAVMPDYERKCSELEADIRSLTFERDCVNAELANTQTELAFLRAVKATAEAFLGRKIEG